MLFVISAFYPVFARPSSSVIYQDPASPNFMLSRIQMKILEEEFPQSFSQDCLFF